MIFCTWLFGGYMPVGSTCTSAAGNKIIAVALRVGAGTEVAVIVTVVSLGGALAGACSLAGVY